MNLNDEIEAFVLANADSKEPHLAAWARLTATGVIQTLNEWQKDEMARGTRSGAIVYAIMNLVGQELSIPMSWAKDGHEEKIAGYLREAVEMELASIVELMRLRVKG